MPLSKWVPSGVLALFASAPLAFFLGLGPANPPPGAPPSLAPSVEAAHVDAQPVAATAEAPSTYCVDRFLSPIQAMAGVVPPEAITRPQPLILNGALTPQGDLQAVVVTASTAAREWLVRLDESIGQLRSSLASDSGPAKITSLIATVPDLVDSGLGYEFETALQVLQRGIETPIDASTYYRDRAWLPWDDRETLADKKAASERCRLSMPGLMLFRGHDPSNTFALLLVGESPTTGVRQAALMNALRIAARFDGSGTPALSQPIRIVGPTFSGSAPSMRLALRNWSNERQTPVSINVISGTATGRDVPRFLRSNGSPFSSKSTISYAATTVPEATVECAYLWALNRRFGVDPKPGATGARQPLTGVATLTESGTEFGATSRQTKPDEKTEPDKRAEPPTPDCAWATAATLFFPFHVSALRDAYETLDHRDEQVHKDQSFARATSLDISLSEKRSPLDIESEVSEKAQTARDIMLENVLAQISKREIRYLGIHATDVGDAIFLARRIRDVAPDVRLAFFESDNLMLHASLHSELDGSMVVSPYPFLGVSDITGPPEPETPKGLFPLINIDGFESSATEGLYNAVLAQRGAPPALLRDYVFNAGQTQLPIWISTLGRNGIIPLQVEPTLDCEGTIFPNKPDLPKAPLCQSASNSSTAWNQFRDAKVADMHLRPDFSLPRCWDLLFVMLAFGFLWDWDRCAAASRKFSTERMPRTFTDKDDQAVDRAIGRTKLRFYAVIRAFVFGLAFTLICAVDAMSIGARGGADVMRGSRVHALTFIVGTGLVVAMWVSATYRCYKAGRSFWYDYRRFARCVGSRWYIISWRDVKAVAPGNASPEQEPESPSRSGQHELTDSTPASAPSHASSAKRATQGPIRRSLDCVGDTPSTLADRGSTRAAQRPKNDAATSRPPASSSGLWARLSLGLGASQTVGALEAARTSFAQLRLLFTATCSLALVFAVLLLGDLVKCSGIAVSRLSGVEAPALALTVLRNTALMSGVSPSTPALLCMTCVYFWSVSRMARLALAHATSRLSPPDSDADLVSTPIRMILHPTHRRDDGADEGFTEVERDVLNSIWRPITGRHYVPVALALAFLPLVLLTLKPLSTLESGWGTWLLGGGLALCILLIGVTLVQLVQFWLAFQRLLRRIMEHALGSAFRTIPNFARDSIDHQISRSPSELLRWSRCAQQFRELVSATAALKNLTSLVTPAQNHELYESANSLGGLRAMALAGGLYGARRNADASVSWHKADRLAVDAEVLLAERIVQATSEVTRILEKAWDLKLTETRAGTEGALVPHTDTLPRGEAKPDAGKTADALTVLEYRFAPTHLAWLREAQTFVATVVTLLIHRHVRQFRYFLHMLTGCALLLLLAVTSYPFEPYRLLLTFVWVVVTSVVVACLWVFVQLDRNTLMSHIAGTSPGAVTFDFALVFRLLAWAVVPILSVAATQYPQFANFLFGFLAPFAHALR